MTHPLPDISISDYHASDAIGFSKLKEFVASPLDFYETRILKCRKKEYERAPHFEIGQAFHLFTQNGLPFYEHVIVNDKYDSWRTNEAKAWRAAQELAGKIVLSPYDFAGIEKMGARLASHSVVRNLLDGTASEVTFRKNFGQWAVQCRPDRYREGLICDFKTVETIDDFERNIVKFSYHMQAAWYQEVVHACLGLPEDAPKARFVFVVIEKNPPYEVDHFELDEDSLAVGRAEVIMALRRMKQCFDTGIWTRSEEIKKISLPRWYVGKAEKKLIDEHSKLALT